MDVLKTLVLGASGNVGSEVIKLLSNDEESVVAGLYSKEVPSTFINVEKVLLDYADVSSLVHATASINQIIVIIPDSPEMEQYAQNIITSCKQNTVKRFVLISGAGVTAAPNNAVSRRLQAMENAFIDSGMQGMILRPTFFMQNLINQFPPNSDDQFLLPMGEGRINYIDIRDVARASVSALNQLDQQTSKIEVIHLTGNESYTMSEVVKILSDAHGKSYYYRDIPIENVTNRMLQAGVPDWKIEMLTEIFHSVQKSSYALHTDDFKQLTRSEPIALPDFAKDYQEFFFNLFLLKP